MSEQDNVDLDTQNQAADDTSVSDTDTNGQGDEGSANDDHDLEWYKQQNQKLFNRAKEAEGYKLVDGRWVKKEKPQPKPVAAKPESTQQSGELSARDILVLSKSSITEEEDIDEVLDFIQYQKSKGESLTVSQALGNNTLKSILADKAEKRRVAEVTNTFGSRRVTSKISGDTLLSNAQTKGVIPESEDQMNELVKTRIFRKR